jgi:hypothetical protein
MGDWKIENIYWLLMNFPDNMLTSCTSIEQGNLPSSHIRKNILYQQRDRDIPSTHIMCLLLNHGWLRNRKYILPSYYLSRLFAHELHFYWAGQPTFQSHWKNLLYQHRDSHIPNTHIVCLLLNHGWQTDEKDLLTSYELSRQFAHELHFYWSG